VKDGKRLKGWLSRKGANIRQKWSEAQQRRAERRAKEQERREKYRGAYEEAFDKAYGEEMARKAVRKGREKAQHGRMGGAGAVLSGFAKSFGNFYNEGRKMGMPSMMDEFGKKSGRSSQQFTSLMDWGSEPRRVRHNRVRRRRPSRRRGGRSITIRI